LLNNSNDEKEIIHPCLMANEGVENQKRQVTMMKTTTCTSDDEEEEKEIENDILDDLYDIFNNCFGSKLIKILLYYIRHQEDTILKSKI